MYPPSKKFTRGLLGKRFEDIHGREQDQDYQALCWDSFEQEYEELFDEGLVVPKPFLKVNQVGNVETEKDTSSEESSDQPSDDEDNKNGGVCMFTSQGVTSPIRETQTVYEDLCPGAVAVTRNESSVIHETREMGGLSVSQLLRGTASPEVRDSQTRCVDTCEERSPQEVRKSKRVEKRRLKRNFGEE